MKISFYTLLLITSSLATISGCDQKQEQTGVAHSSNGADVSTPAPTTIAEAKSQGAKKLSTDEIKTLIVGGTVTIRHLPTGNEITGYHNLDGTRTLVTFNKDNTSPNSNAGSAARAPYRIEGDQLYAIFQGKPISTTIYQLNDRYLAAVDAQGGTINYELVLSKGK
jgi:hypothetical protein